MAAACSHRHAAFRGAGGRVLIKTLGRQPYAETVEAMRAFTEGRSGDTPDELWLVEHDPVYTQGLAGKPEHLLAAGGIPVVATNRGGQVTYHGPGQVVAYPLVDLKRLGIYVKEYVYRLEHAVLKVLEAHQITGHRVAGAPGIYVRLDDPGSHAALEPWRRAAPSQAHPLGGQAPSGALGADGSGPMPGDDPFRGLGKVAALGIKVSRHCTYHGVALNVAMDLAPFDGINPCGYAGLATVDLAKLGASTDWATVAGQLGDRLAAQFTP